ncbi:ADIPA protein, partial [Polyodon spathula]|nr:ADIPA protein [Polyodon spathula]
MSSLGFPTISNGKIDLNLVSVLNMMYELLQLWRKSMCTVEDMENQQLKSEGEMYKVILDNYENWQKDLMMKNVELKKVLQQMKMEMVSILSTQKHGTKERIEDHLEQAVSDYEEDAGEHSGENISLELSCKDAWEQLTNSIRQQWRRLKSQMEKLDNKASLVQMGTLNEKDLISRDVHKEETEKLKLEIQQRSGNFENKLMLLCSLFLSVSTTSLFKCLLPKRGVKCFLSSCQPYGQQQLSYPCDDETGGLLCDYYLVEEKEQLKEEWRLFDEQRKNFERERRNFTEDAIRLEREVLLK